MQPVRNSIPTYQEIKVVRWDEDFCISLETAGQPDDIIKAVKDHFINYLQPVATGLERLRTGSRTTYSLSSIANPLISGEAYYEDRTNGAFAEIKRNNERVATMQLTVVPIEHGARVVLAVDLDESANTLLSEETLKGLIENMSQNLRYDAADYSSILADVQEDPRNLDYVNYNLSQATRIAQSVGSLDASHVHTIRTEAYRKLLDKMHSLIMQDDSMVYHESFEEIITSAKTYNVSLDEENDAKIAEVRMHFIDKTLDLAESVASITDTDYPPDNIGLIYQVIHYVEQHALTLTPEQEARLSALERIHNNQ